ncbi:hypothetical protein ACLM5J_06090 [Nocardioides sp. Bht2]|uniref:hypothetical protein n=1 Tax=Nocardioides sp. Bht2 TaxID=3392297 RepID=UPI0039B45A78
MSEPTKRRPRHLMDPNNLQARPRNDSMSIGQVQKWVMSVLAVTTILHLVVGMILLAYSLDEQYTTSRWGLLVISAVFGLLMVVTGRAIHRASLLTPWLLLGLVPSIVGAWFLR